jgi:hypothetical protein
VSAQKRNSAAAKSRINSSKNQKTAENSRKQQQQQ